MNGKKIKTETREDAEETIRKITEVIREAKEELASG